MYNFERLLVEINEIVETCYEGESNQDVSISFLSKAFAVACFRNGKIEDFHSEIKELTDDCMRELNKDVCNRIYTLLSLLTSDTDLDYEALKNLVAFSALYAQSWDNPEIEEDMIVKNNI